MLPLKNKKSGLKEEFRCKADDRSGSGIKEYKECVIFLYNLVEIKLYFFS